MEDSTLGMGWEYVLGVEMGNYLARFTLEYLQGVCHMVENV